MPGCATSPATVAGSTCGVLTPPPVDRSEYDRGVRRPDRSPHRDPVRARRALAETQQTRQTRQAQGAQPGTASHGRRTAHAAPTSQDAVRSTVLPQPIASQAAFKVQAALRRPEAAARLWLLDRGRPAGRAGVGSRHAQCALAGAARQRAANSPFRAGSSPSSPCPSWPSLLHLLGRATPPATRWCWPPWASPPWHHHRHPPPSTPEHKQRPSREPSRGASERHADRHTRHRFLYSRRAAWGCLE